MMEWIFIHVKITAWIVALVYCAEMGVEGSSGSKTISHQVASSICQQHATYTESKEIQPPVKALEGAANARGVGSCYWYRMGAEGDGGEVKKIHCNELKGMMPREGSADQDAAPSANDPPYIAPKDFYKSHAQFLLANDSGWSDGVILDEYSVLIPADTVRRGILRWGSVLVGRYNWYEIEPDEQYFEIDKNNSIYIHPNGTDKEFSMGEPGFVDLAIVKTKTPIKFSDKVQPVTLPDAPLTDDALPLLHFVTSESNDALTGKPINYTQKFELTPITNAKCREIVRYDIEQRICVDHIELEKPRERWCILTAGAPAYLIDENDPNKQTLIGTYSFNWGSCYSDIPMWVFTQVYQHLDWIKEIMDKKD